MQNVYKIYFLESSTAWIYKFIDLVTPMITIYTIVFILKIKWNVGYFIIGCKGSLIFLLLSQYTGIYSNSNSVQSLITLSKTIKPWIMTSVILITGLFLLKQSNFFSRTSFIIWVFTTPLTTIVVKFIIQHLILKINKKLIPPKKIAIIGINSLSKKLAESINGKIINATLELFCFDQEELELSINNINIKNSSEKLITNAKKNQYAEIYICLPLKKEEMIKSLINQLSDTTAIVKFVPDIFSFKLTHNQITSVGGIPAFSIYDTPLNSVLNQIIKRAEDLFLSTIILILISPIMLIIAIVVKASSQGGIFYKQTRVSWNGKKFTMLKFRSMPVNIEKNGIQWGNSKNKTNTQFGKFIRATNLDELPQFINVLKGDMSIVGPRPERDIFVEKFRKKIPGYMQKHMVKAGITGLAQINGWRGDTCLEKRIEYDLRYIKNWNIGLDIQIIFLTIFKENINKNAY